MVDPPLVDVDSGCSVGTWAVQANNVRETNGPTSRSEDAIKSSSVGEGSFSPRDMGTLQRKSNNVSGGAGRAATHQVGGRCPSHVVFPLPVNGGDE
jgi:hypothetical protein